MAEQRERRARPSPELMAALWESKAALHKSRLDMPLKEKVRTLLELQRICLPLIARQRPLAPWERPWEIDP